MIKFFDGQIFASIIKSGANNLINSKNRIDALNVFPVPDGDTGTNMSYTVQAAIDNINNLAGNNLGEISAKVAKSMLFGARGNSGVILSQIFKGFALGFENLVKVDVFGLLKAFKMAYEKAYASVLKAVEGTILTVIREVYEGLEKEVDKETTFEKFFELVVKLARISCDNTPNKLKVLREVGVTDSGGEGLYTIFVGMEKAVRGEIVELGQEQDSFESFVSDSEVYDGEFGYCTEFILELTNKNEFEIRNFEKELKKKATSLVVVKDDDIVKVHGHTLKPGELLNLAQKHGEFAKIKSENMTKQASESKNKNLQANSENNELNECGIVSCNLGSGIIERMRELGADAIVESGQSQNPSARDLIDAINLVNAKNVFILPNNSNIFLTATQAATAIQDKKVFVIPTKSQIQGVNAILNFDKDNKAKENEKIMNNAIKLVVSAEVTRAVRNTKLHGIKIKEGQFIGIANSKILTSEDDFLTSARNLIKKLITKNTELITIYYGNEVSENDAFELETFIQNQYDVEVEIVNGNQPTYHFLIGFE
ncbi:Dihydroxyacetone kinase family protein [Mycoplasmopsis meleagridis]|uniref:Dihydroxyacetone kinase family protein n=1 Tax=Mycoplasmopsis meleagridis ATCC 25294 TaxID=1264554 RepID=A0A0F5H0D2_9BACT|nr:DAK2 domain-containing protein [Mycoplasmopsis meleagridis]KKB26781.1 Dihydroxyacetone kinase family protein [Mycoplasmopsis meleagridis ATCC 25294]OAD18103.1 Dihydroxyacetone kinase family protein [Mycoplasmopsis meleagridis]VEU77315.1 kinase [Mycoplasmopsis meleagridis]